MCGSIDCDEGSTEKERRSRGLECCSRVWLPLIVPLAASGSSPFCTKAAEAAGPPPIGEDEGDAAGVELEVDPNPVGVEDPEAAGFEDPGAPPVQLGVVDAPGPAVAPWPGPPLGLFFLAFASRMRFI